MAHSGIEVAHECLEAFNELKLGHSLKYVIFKPDDKCKCIIVEKRGLKDATFEDFRRDIEEGLKDKVFRYAVFDTPCPTHPKQTKLVLCTWAPQELGCRQKTICATSEEWFKERLNYTDHTVEIMDKDDCTLDAFVAKAAFREIDVQY